MHIAEHFPTLVQRGDPVYVIGGTPFEDAEPLVVNLGDERGIDGHRPRLARPAAVAHTRIRATTTAPASGSSAPGSSHLPGRFRRRPARAAG
jgi:hypothetical protein